MTDWQFNPPATIYTQLLELPADEEDPTITLSFVTVTSFRCKGNHFPLPVPCNLFHSYLRPWTGVARATQITEAWATILVR